ncbi:MAG TPA: GNAT family N-acetyltransferase [Ktedonobacterales bacterium]|nr:GNAT family N-acetyltransferase [Ktedonobacterales bacterium]
MSDGEKQPDMGVQLGAWTERDGLNYEALENPPMEVLRAVNRGLDTYNRTKIGDYDYARLGVFAYADAERQTLIGGVFGDLLWDWLHVDSLWVHDDYRGRGVGSALMRYAEEVARARGIANIHLETTTFQALPFYRKLGYELFGELPNKPRGSTWYYLKKEGEPIEGETGK